MMICKYKEVHGTLQAVIEQEGQTEYPRKWDKDELTFAVVQASNDVTMLNKLEQMVRKAFDVWQAVIPINFIRVSADANPDITFKWENNPDADDYLKESPNVLAYAYFPKTIHQGVVVFNDYAYVWGTKPATLSNGVKVYNAVHVAIHELGHTLGLTHDESEDSKDVMDPYYSGEVITLSENDLARIQAKYGKRPDEPVHNDTFAIYPITNESELLYDERLIPFVKGWSATTKYKEQEVKIPGTWNSDFIVDRYFKVVKSPDSPNSGESENEICLVLMGGWHPYDVEVIIQLFIRGTDVSDGTNKVSAEIIKTSGNDMTLFHNNKKVTNFKKRYYGFHKRIDKVWIDNLN